MRQHQSDDLAECQREGPVVRNDLLPKDLEYGCIAGDPPLSFDDRRDPICGQLEGLGQCIGVNRWV